MASTPPPVRLAAVVVLAAALPLSAGCGSATLRLRGGRECVELTDIPRASAHWISTHSGPKHQSAVALRVPTENFKCAAASPPDRVPATPCRTARGPVPGEEEKKEIVRPNDASDRTRLGFVGTLQQNWPILIGKR